MAHSLDAKYLVTSSSTPFASGRPTITSSLASSLTATASSFLSDFSSGF
jgi:hypothetical protein